MPFPTSERLYERLSGSFALPRKSPFSRQKVVICATTIGVIFSNYVGIGTATAHTPPTVNTAASTPNAGFPDVNNPGFSGADFTAGRYIVTLIDDAVATYEGGIPGLPATKPGKTDELDLHNSSVNAYTMFLENEQHDIASSVDASVDYSYTLALNGFSTELTAEQATQLFGDKRVANITPDTLYKTTATSSTEFLGLNGPNGVWAGIGGAKDAGKGVVVGIIDSGIAPENPSFSGIHSKQHPAKTHTATGMLLILTRQTDQNSRAHAQPGNNLSPPIATQNWWELATTSKASAKTTFDLLKKENTSHLAMAVVTDRIPQVLLRETMMWPRPSTE